jgi:hypothetical protein
MLNGWSRAACALIAVLAGCSGSIDQSGGEPSFGPGSLDNGNGNGNGSGAGRGPGNGAQSGNGAGAAGSSAGPGAGAEYVASESVARRLSRAEIDNVLRDLVGDDTAPATRLLAEDLFSPFDNDYASQVASGALIDSLEVLARDVAGRVAADAAMRARLVPCTPTGPGDAACFQRVSETFLRRAFRRPVTAAEVEPYMTLLSFATEDIPEVDNDFYTAVELLVRSVLQDPEWLYRIEVGTPTQDPSVRGLNGYEIASRMSFLLWGSGPDDGLLQAAGAGMLGDDETRRGVAEQMLGNARAKAQLHRFHAMWLGYRALPHPPELTSAFQRETNALLDRVIFEEQRSYLDLFTFDETYLDDALAEHYGLPRPSGGAGWVPYGDSGRAGILSHGSVLSAFSKFTDTSPTQRGIFVRTRLLCQTIGRPPANVVADQPPGDQDAVCKTDRYAEHRSNGACASCHDQLDPIGFGLEQFDIAGRKREHDDGLPQCEIEGQGQVTGHGTFSGPAELGALLVEEELIQECIVRQLAQFALGRKTDDSEDELIEALASRFAGNGYEFERLLVDYVAEPAFALRREPEEAP